MKVAVSSATFARTIAAGELTQLEWLDACANELEVDGVVFDLAQFPRTDGEYLAQLKKQASDLGLTVAALAADDAFGPAGDALIGAAIALGAPLVIGRAPAGGDDPAAWGAFADAVKERSRAAKAANVTVAVRNAPGTLCATPGDLKRLAKDVDSAWLRFAFDAAAFGPADPASTILAKSVIAVHAIAGLTRFAEPGDDEAAALIGALARFRGFLVLETRDAPEPRDAFHRAAERFATARANALQGSASAAS
jgi:sugar phosphate isomerase/epimerase